MIRGVFNVLLFAVLALITVEVHLQSVVFACAQEEVTAEIEADEPTCSLDPTSSKSDCATADPDTASDVPSHNTGEDLTRHVISLTDDTFDQLTSTATPATWLIMFKTNSCAICKKAMPVLRDLSVDVDIVSHNDRELEALSKGQLQHQKEQLGEEKAKSDSTPKGPVYVYEQSTEEGGVPAGPIYVATVDAGWSGKDITKRFEVDATPTIILLRNEGGHPKEGVDSRSYYVYRSQRATYPLRNFVLGGYATRKQLDMPLPLSDEERKPDSYLGRISDYLISSPSARWAGGTVLKILLGWFSFIIILGLFMRIHNYAWGENANDYDPEEKEREIEREKAQGRKEFEASNKPTSTAEERSARRQKAMWERKANNRAKFAANREAKETKTKTGGDKQEGDEDEMEGVGYAVKKYPQKVKGGGANKSKNN